MTAFVPHVAPRAALPSRRPSFSRLRPSSARVASIPRAQLTPDSSQQNQPQQSQPIVPNTSSPVGFSLRDVPSFNFQDLSTNSESLSVSGVYAIRGPDQSILYMGYSKNVAAKLQFHQSLQPQSCVSFQVYVPPLPPELISPDLLESVLEYWVRETGTVPRGNTVDRALWENPNPIPRKPAPNQPSEPPSDIPVRKRTTPPRARQTTASQTPTTPSDTFSDAFRTTAEREVDWNASDDDYVQVDVDPFDPFSASKKRAAPRSPWADDDEEDRNSEDWLPILALAGVAGLIWLIGVLGNALPAATPSMGM